MNNATTPLSISGEKLNVVEIALLSQINWLTNRILTLENVLRENLPATTQQLGYSSQTQLPLDFGETELSGLLQMGRSVKRIHEERSANGNIFPLTKMAKRPDMDRFSREVRAMMIPVITENDIPTYISIGAGHDVTEATKSLRNVFIWNAVDREVTFDYLNNGTEIIRITVSIGRDREDRPGFSETPIKSTARRYLALEKVWLDHGVEEYLEEDRLYKSFLTCMKGYLLNYDWSWGLQASDAWKTIQSHIDEAIANRELGLDADVIYPVIEEMTKGNFYDENRLYLRTLKHSYDGSVRLMQFKNIEWNIREDGTIKNPPSKWRYLSKLDRIKYVADFQHAFDLAFEKAFPTPIEESVS